MRAGRRLLAVCLVAILLVGCARTRMLVSAQEVARPVSFSEGIHRDGGLVLREGYEVVHHFEFVRGHSSWHRFESPGRVDLSEELRAIIDAHDGDAILNLRVSARTRVFSLLNILLGTLTLSLVSPGYVEVTVGGDVVRLFEREIE